MVRGCTIIARDGRKSSGPALDDAHRGAVGVGLQRRGKPRRTGPDDQDVRSGHAATTRHHVGWSGGRSNRSATAAGEHLVAPQAGSTW